MSIYKEFNLHWRGREVLISYCEDYSAAFRQVMGAPLAHLTIQSADGEKLPISDTGFLSHFAMGGLGIENDDQILALVQERLNEEAKNQAWQEYVRDSQQLRLF